MISIDRIERAAGLVVFSLLAVGCFVVLRPFMSALLWAMVLTFSTWPIYTWLVRRLGGRNRLAALLMTLLVAAVLVVPLAILGATLAEHVAGVASIVRVLLDEGLPAPPGWLAGIPLFGAEIEAYWASLAQDQVAFAAAVEPYIARAGNWTLRSGASLGQGALELTLSVVACFFFYRDGLDAAAKLRSSMDRLAGSRAQYLLDVAGRTVTGVVYGLLGTAVAQGALAAVGLWIAGVPGALLLGFLTFVVSPIPFGPPLIWVPATVWLFYSGEAGWGVFLALWGLLGISSIDNVVKPYLISRESRLPMLLVFLGVIGGVLAFGVVGVFLGPTLLAVGFTLVQEWTAPIVRAAPDEAASVPPP